MWALNLYSAPSAVVAKSRNFLVNARVKRLQDDHKRAYAMHYIRCTGLMHASSSSRQLDSASDHVAWSKRLSSCIWTITTWHHHACVLVNPILQIFYKIQTHQTREGNASPVSWELMRLYFVNPSCNYFTKYKRIKLDRARKSQDASSHIDFVDW